MDQKFLLGGLVGYETFHLVSILCYSKVLRQHTKLHDAAGAVRSHTGKGPGYCYIIGQGPNSCLIGHLTGLLNCSYVKISVPSIFNSVDFLSSMSCFVVLDIGLEDRNIIKELGVFADGKVQGYSFRHPKKYKPTKQIFWCTKNLYGIVWNSGRLDYSELSNILPRAVRGENFGKGTEECKIVGKLLDKEVENSEDHGCPKVQDLIDRENWIGSSYAFRHKITLHCAELKAKVFGAWTMQHLKLSFLYCVL